MSDLAMDDAPEAFFKYDRDLKARGTASTRSREDALRIKALVETWFRTYRPAFSAVIGEAGALVTVDEVLQKVRSKVGGRIVIAELRSDLRAVGRTIQRELLPAYETARWTSAAVPVDDRPDSFETRLRLVDPGLADSYQQALRDLDDETRLTFVGPAGEIREVFREVVHRLSPDDAVRQQTWYVGYDGKPTQTERIRYIRSTGGMTDSASRTADLIDTRVGQIGRATYSRASAAFHAGTDRAEVQSVLLYVQAVLNEILPLPD